MARILVVDDSLVDRRMVAGLLAQDLQLSVDFVSDGVAALEHITRDPPDLILTDLQMPRMDGLELIVAARSKYPLIPIVVMTAKGNEEIAVQALRSGAASYVPKRSLSRNLLETIYGVLAVARQERELVRLMDYLNSWSCDFTLPNQSALIPPLVTYLQQHLSRVGVCDDADRIRVGVALEEALVNALYHGNLEVSSQAREQDWDAYEKLVQERRGQPPYCDRRIHLSAQVSRQQAVFVIRDDGPGFDVREIPDPGQTDLDKLSGRGLLLMRTFMDEVAFNSQGNQVTLVKKSRRAG
jgi:CheY-like chemotaxis protein